MPQSWDMGHIFQFPSEGRHALRIFTTPEKSNGFGRGLNPRTRVPEASMSSDVTRVAKQDGRDRPNMLYLRGGKVYAGISWGNRKERGHL
jgi:hypothetical protein